MDVCVYGLYLLCMLCMHVCILCAVSRERGVWEEEGGKTEIEKLLLLLQCVGLPLARSLATNRDTPSV